ncbi:MAG: glycoside hydrolase, partial [Ignavibacteriaceae bacterium]|nr:glycoside hydrolase [Ignavibacteriaceae bacterium]
MNHIFEKKSFYNIIKLVLFLVIVFLISPGQIISQTTKQKISKAPDPTAHHEIKDDDYVPVLRKNQGRSPAYKYSMSNISTVQVNVDENGQNIVGDAANEPSIAVDPNGPNRMAIGWRQFNTITSNFRQAGYGFTTDGGQTWIFPGVIEPGIFRSDPVLDSDSDGNFYYNSLTNSPEYYCDVFKSNSGGSSWDGGTYAQGGDKQWMTIDKTGGPGTGHNYSFWTSSYSVCYPGFFTRSTDGGGSFEDCITIPDDPYWGTLAVGPEGELYIGGTTGSDFLVAKSTNAQNSSEMVTWDMTTVVDLGGSISVNHGPNPGGLLGQTLIATDTSNGPYHGNVYLLCSVERKPDPLDVMFVRSTDGGINWSSPNRVNDDPNTTAYQWFGTMSVAPNGRIDVVWLDTRDNPGTYLSALYYSNSTDGGVTWSPNERFSDYFDPHVG